MTATKTSHHLLAQAKRYLADFDPNATSATIATIDAENSAKCLAIKDMERVLFGISQTVGTGGLSAFQVIAATAAAGTGATVVTSHALGSNPNAVDDFIWLEVDVEMIREALATATHVGIRPTAVTSTDEFKIYVEVHGRYQYGGQTADYVS